MQIGSSEEEIVPKSKNALKRERKTAFWKEKKMLKKSSKNEIKSNAKDDDCTGSEGNCDPEAAKEVAEARRKRKDAEKEDFHRLCDSCYSVVIDCNFESDHNDSSLGNERYMIIQQKKICWLCFFYDK